MTKSDLLYQRALKVMTGGVNSPVRAFRSVNMNPLFIDRAEGCYVYDVDGNKYIDYVCSWGPMLLGHCQDEVIKNVSEALKYGLSFGACTNIEVEMAELITSIVPNVDMVRMVNSGTEATMSAVRLARGFTKRDKIIKFEGCYHGHSDSMLVKAGSGALTSGKPDSEGVTEGTAACTLIAEYNNIDSVKKLFDSNKDEIAAVIIEPVAANMGVVIPNDGFLEGIRELCTKNSSLLIFDEVITGFRLAAGGAQEYFGIDADVVCFGKIIGGGMPVGAYGGSKEIMEYVAPCGPVYQAGTLSGNPIAMTAGITQLKIIAENKSIFKELEKKGRLIADGLRSAALKNNVDLTVNQIGSLVCPFFADGAVKTFSDAIKSDTERFAQYFKSMINSGVYIAPSQFEAMFLSMSHTDDDIDFTIKAMESAII